MRIRFFALAALALLLGACTQDEAGFLPEGAEGTPIVFTATGLNPAATATAGTRAPVDGNWEGVQSVAVLMDGTVKNVVMEGVQITSNQIYGGSIGGVVGYSWGTIENCSVSGSVSGTVYVGGVVGAQIGGSITGCSSSATVKGTVDVGGVAGQTNSSATLTACYATGNVIIEINPKKNIAGGSLVGMNAGSSLLACYATGNVTSTGSSTGKVHIGGFLGNNYTTVTACYWKNNHEQGIGYNRESTGATKVDGSVVTWQKAVDAMNTALQNAGSEWRYELKGALPTLRKQ